MSSTDQLLDTLIGQVSKLTESVDRLVVIDAAREERDKRQEEKNERYDTFIEENAIPLARVKRFQGHWDKASDKVFTLIVIAILAAAGFNFLG